MSCAPSTGCWVSHSIPVCRGEYTCKLLRAGLRRPLDCARRRVVRCVWIALPQENPDRRPAARSRSIARTLSPSTLDRVQQHIGDTFEAVSQLLNEAQGSEQEDQIISVGLLISQAEQRLAVIKHDATKLRSRATIPTRKPGRPREDEDYTPGGYTLSRPFSFSVAARRGLACPAREFDALSDRGGARGAD